MGSKVNKVKEALTAMEQKEVSISNLSKGERSSIKTLRSSLGERKASFGATSGKEDNLNVANDNYSSQNELVIESHGIIYS